MKCEGTNFSHTFVRIRSKSIDRDLIYQATSSGVHFVGSVLFESSAQVVEEYQIPVSDEDRKRLLRWAVDNAGKPYGYLQLLGIGLIRLAKIVGINIGNPFSNGDKAYVCCELVAEALQGLGILVSDKLDQVDLTVTRDIVRRTALALRKGQDVVI